MGSSNIWAWRRAAYTRPYSATQSENCGCGVGRGNYGCTEEKGTEMEEGEGAIGESRLGR
jgi:hypothetical protein